MLICKWIVIISSYLICNYSLITSLVTLSFYSWISCSWYFSSFWLLFLEIHFLSHNEVFNDDRWQHKFLKSDNTFWNQLVKICILHLSNSLQRRNRIHISFQVHEKKFIVSVKIIIIKIRRIKNSIHIRVS